MSRAIVVPVKSELKRRTGLSSAEEGGLRGWISSIDVMTGRLNWPPWWEWELVFTDYTEARMDERLCTELDVRRMMEHASHFSRGKREGRWEIETRFRGNPCKVIVEPDRKQSASSS